MIREPVVAGQFYPSSAQGLIAEIEQMVEKDAQAQKVIGVVSPHAGYIYSGPVAASLFSRVEITDTVIVLGPNHTGFGAKFSLYSKGKWHTPLGDLEIDEDLAADLLNSTNLISDDTKAHAHEHSLEVQLPIMQYFRRDFKIVPMVLSYSTFESYREVGEATANSIKNHKRPVLIVASSDMTHYEPHSTAKNKDKVAIDAILELDEGSLLEKVEKHNITMCGSIPVAVMLIAAKALGAQTAQLVKYQTSGETSGDYSAVVGYAGVMVQ